MRQLERKFLLQKMKERDQQQNYSARAKAWLEKAELVKNLKATISPDMKPEAKAQALLRQARNYIGNTGFKIT